MARADRNQLREFVDYPREALDVEYKSVLDLDQGEIRADLARHLAALANYGGGIVVFGFNDDMTIHDGARQVIDQDTVSGIVKRYLEPTFQCEVVTVVATSGSTHSVVLVPPHGMSPICARASGPNNKGISQGTYYTRKPGPESAPVLTPSEWAPIIRRCAMHERASILSAIDSALRGATESPANESEKLRQWHEAARAKFLVRAKAENRAPPLAENHWQCSYLIATNDGMSIDPNRLLDVLREVNGEVHDLIRTGWSMFYPFGNENIRPYFTTDPQSGMGETDFLELEMLRDTDERTIGADFWRVSSDGKATIIRDYWEDSPNFASAVSMPPGSFLSPNMVAQSLAEVVRHARGLAERFPTATNVFFRAEWWGLSNRMLADARGFWRLSGRQSVTPHCVSSGSWPVVRLSSDLPAIVAALAAPLARALGIGEEMTAEWVKGQQGRWLH